MREWRYSSPHSKPEQIKWPTSISYHFTLGKQSTHSHWIGFWVDQIASPDVSYFFKKKKNYSTLLQIKPWFLICPAHSLVTVLTELSWFLWYSSVKKQTSFFVCFKQHMWLSYKWSFCIIKTCKPKDSACKECGCTNMFQAHLIHAFTGVTLPVLLYICIVIYIDTFKHSIKFPLKLVGLFKTFYYSHSWFFKKNRRIILPEAQQQYSVISFLWLCIWSTAAGKVSQKLLTHGSEQQVKHNGDYAVPNMRQQFNWLWGTHTWRVHGFDTAQSLLVSFWTFPIVFLSITLPHSFDHIPRWRLGMGSQSQIPHNLSFCRQW